MPCHQRLRAASKGSSCDASHISILRLPVCGSCDFVSSQVTVATCSFFYLNTRPRKAVKDIEKPSTVQIHHRIKFKYRVKLLGIGWFRLLRAVKLPKRINRKPNSFFFWHCGLLFFKGRDWVWCPKLHSSLHCLHLGLTLGEGRNIGRCHPSGTPGRGPFDEELMLRDP